MPVEVSAVYRDLMAWDAERIRNEIADAEVKAAADAAASEIVERVRF